MTEFTGSQSVRVDPFNRGDVSGNWGWPSSATGRKNSDSTF